MIHRWRRSRPSASTRQSASSNLTEELIRDLTQSPNQENEQENEPNHVDEDNAGEEAVFIPASINDEQAQKDATGSFGVK